MDACYLHYVSSFLVNWLPGTWEIETSCLLHHTTLNSLYKLNMSHKRLAELTALHAFLVSPG